MIYNSIFFLATEKTGGLFDLDGTLPLVMLQFLSLMFLLNSILYTPLLEILQKRDQLIKENLSKALTLIAESDKLTARYQKRLIKFTKVSDAHSLRWQKKLKIVLDSVNVEEQTSLNKISDEIEETFAFNRNVVLVSLLDEIEKISDEIVAKIIP